MTAASLFVGGLITFVLVSDCLAADAVQCALREGAAVQLLQERVESERLYVSWTTMSCLSYYVEACNSSKTDIAIHELHNERCGGDPATWPVVDRFRVYKKSGRIQWHDILKDEYVPFTKIHSIGDR